MRAPDPRMKKVEITGLETLRFEGVQKESLNKKSRGERNDFKKSHSLADNSNKKKFINLSVSVEEEDAGSIYSVLPSLPLVNSMTEADLRFEMKIRNPTVDTTGKTRQWLLDKLKLGTVSILKAREQVGRDRLLKVPQVGPSLTVEHLRREFFHRFPGKQKLGRGKWKDWFIIQLGVGSLCLAPPEEKLKRITRAPWSPQGSTSNTVSTCLSESTFPTLSTCTIPTFSSDEGEPKVTPFDTNTNKMVPDVSQDGTASVADSAKSRQKIHSNKNRYIKAFKVARQTAQEKEAKHSMMQVEPGNTSKANTEPAPKPFEIGAAKKLQSNKFGQLTDTAKETPYKIPYLNETIEAKANPAGYSEPPKTPVTPSNFKQQSSETPRSRRRNMGTTRERYFKSSRASRMTSCNGTGSGESQAMMGDLRKAMVEVEKKIESQKQQQESAPTEPTRAAKSSSGKRQKYFNATKSSRSKRSSFGGGESEALQESLKRAVEVEKEINQRKEEGCNLQDPTKKAPSSREALEEARKPAEKGSSRWMNNVKRARKLARNSVG
ncbi:expressed unknown protein [Seminavis robusta]|uniref:Uncharacterized protein n=1 Tax=Seminavis robusta TaxID=568900 RepID=A0A9N8H670_9STRA|nr:expressed unknown protein [Seminavis robusta]|eukprot:Sro104_g052850.1 n/a (549) ;mRNA; f:61258-62904